MAAYNKEIATCDALVFAGGSIFQDVSSVKSVAYYSNLVKKAKKAGKKVIMLGQGVGPLNSTCGKMMAAKAFNACNAIAVRDPASAKALCDLGVTPIPRVTGDLAFLLPKPQVDDASSGNFQVGDMKTVGLAPRPFGKGNEVVQLFGEVAKLLFQAKLMPVLIELDRNMDAALMAEIDKANGGKVPSIRKLTTPMAVQQRLVRMDSVIAMRLHAGILAATVGVPSYMVSYDPKVTAFAQLMDLPTAPPLKGLTAQRLFDNFMQFQKSKSTFMKTFERKIVQQQEAARMNIPLLLENL